MALRHNRPSPLVRSCAHFAVESLERRCLLSTASTTDAALIAGWNSMSAAARHAIAVVEYVNPDFHAALDADLASLGLDPIPAVPGSLPDPAFGKSKHHHARPHKTFLYHAKPKRHHRKDGPAAPTVSAAFYYDTLPNQLTFTFDQDVSSPDWNAALTLIDLNTGATVPATGVYSTQSVVYTLNNSGTLPNANFAAILHGSLVSSTSTGLHLAGSDSTPGDDFSTPFFFANADVNRDRVVNLGDVNVISSHFNAHPATFTQGDANFDTSVNIGDVNLVSQLYNTDFPLLTSPSAPTATPISASSVSLSWPPVPGIDSYDLYRSDPSGTLQVFSDLSLPTYTDTTVDPQTAYSYFAVSRDTSSNSSYAGPQTVVNLSAYVGAVTGLSAPLVDTTTATLAWSDTDTISSFQIFRGTTPGGEATIPVGTTDPSARTFTDTGLSPGTAYYYTIRPVLGGYHEAMSGELAVVTKPATDLPDDYGDTLPESPGTLGATQGATNGSGPDSSITLNWTTSAGSDIIYEIQRNGIAVGDTSSTTFTDVGLDPSTSYNYKVIAVDGAYNRSAPATITKSTSNDTTPPTAPQNLWGTRNPDGSITLTWQVSGDNVGVDHYAIYMTDGTTSTFVGTSPTTSYKWITPPATIQNMYVEAVDAASNYSLGTYLQRSVSSTAVPYVEDSVTHQYLPPEWVHYLDVLEMAAHKLAVYAGGLWDPAGGKWMGDAPAIVKGTTTGVGTLVSAQQTPGTTNPFLAWTLTDGNGASTPLAANPTLIEGSVAVFSGAKSWNYQTDPVWIDSLGTGAFGEGDTILYNPTGHSIAPGTLATGLVRYTSVAPNTNAIWADFAPSQPYGAGVQTQFEDLYRVISSLASLSADPDSSSSNPVRWSLGALLDRVNGGPIAGPAGTITVDSARNFSISGVSFPFSFAPGDIIRIGNEWWPAPQVQFTSASQTVSLSFLGAVPVTSAQSLEIENWTLIPTEAPSDNCPGLSFTRGTPGVTTFPPAMFREQFAQLTSALQVLQTVLPMNIAQGIAQGQTNTIPAPTIQWEGLPDSTIPLTSVEDYFNQLPDSDVDGIVQVPQDQMSFGNDSGSIQFEPNLPLSQAYLPLFANTTQSINS